MIKLHYLCDMVKFPATVQVSAGGVENIFDIFLDTDSLGWQIPTPTFCSLLSGWMKILLSTQGVKKKSDLDACTLTRFESIGSNLPNRLTYEHE